MGATLREAGYGIEKESLHLAAWYDRARLFLLGQLCLCALMHSEESRLAIRWSAFFVTAFGLIRKLLECSEKELRRSFRSDVRRAPGCLHASRETFSSQSPSTHHTKSSPKTRFFPSFQCTARSICSLRLALEDPKNQQNLLLAGHALVSLDLLPVAVQTLHIFCPSRHQRQGFSAISGNTSCQRCFQDAGLARELAVLRGLLFNL